MFARFSDQHGLRNKSEQEDDETEQLVYTKVIGNRVYFKGEISEDSIHELVTVLNRVQMDLIIKCAQLCMDPPGIVLFIHSDGGCVFSGLSGMDHVRSLKLPVTTVVDGVCCSAATFVLLGGHKRLVMRNSYVLIHQLSNTLWGKFEELKDEMQTVTKLMDHIRNLYQTETQLSDKKLNKLMKRDIYLDSEECIKYGIASSFYS
jgi:ATP-dependent Clp endopeptidase proteolytic subunit ClpP